MSAVGWWRCCIITRQASATSFASQGRITFSPGIGPQRGELLDRLMGGAVLAEPDRVVAEPVDHRELHQRREADRGSRVVREGQVRRPRRAGACSARARSRSRPTRARGCRSGGLGPCDPPAGTPPSPRASKSRPPPAEPVRSAEPLRSHGTLAAIAFSDLVRRLAGRQALLVGLEARDVGVPAVGQLAALHLVDLGRDLRVAVRHPLLPLRCAGARPRSPTPRAKCS